MIFIKPTNVNPEGEIYINPNHISSVRELEFSWWNDETQKEEQGIGTKIETGRVTYYARESVQEVLKAIEERLGRRE